MAKIHHIKDPHPRWVVCQQPWPSSLIKQVPRHSQCLPHQPPPPPILVIQPHPAPFLHLNAHPPTHWPPSTHVHAYWHPSNPLEPIHAHWWPLSPTCCPHLTHPRSTPFPHLSPPLLHLLELRTVAVSTVVRPYVTAMVTIPWRSGAPKIRPWFYGCGRHWSNSHDIQPSVAWLDSDQLNEAKFEVKIKLSQNLSAHGRHQWSAEPYSTVHGTARVWAVPYRGG